MSSEPSAWGQIIQHISTSSALNPALIACAICVPTGLTLAGLASIIELKIVGAVIALAPVVATTFQLLYFTIKEPERLQSEKHIEHKMVIAHQISIRKGDDIVDIALPIQSSVIENPSLDGVR